MALKATPHNTLEKSRKVIVTAGPTLEYLDPVRYLSNRSTGVMGYSIAKEFIKRGFQVSLITGPVRVLPPKKAEVVHVTSAGEMREEIVARMDNCGCLVMAAAVCDFRPAKKQAEKIKKKKGMELKLVRNPDILGLLRKNEDFVKIGFALETNNEEQNGKKKLKGKCLDLIVINSAAFGSQPFGKSVTDYVFLEKGGNRKIFTRSTKAKIARKICDEAQKLMREKYNEDKNIKNR